MSGGGWAPADLPAPRTKPPAARAPAPRYLPAAGRGAPRCAGLGRTPGGGERAGAGRGRVGGGRGAPPCRGSGQNCFLSRAPGALGDVAAPRGGASPGHPAPRPVGGARAPFRARTRLWARPLLRLRSRGTGSPFPARPAWGRSHRLLLRGPPTTPHPTPQVPPEPGVVVVLLVGPGAARESGCGGGEPGGFPAGSPWCPGPRPGGEDAAGGVGGRGGGKAGRLGSPRLKTGVVGLVAVGG